MTQDSPALTEAVFYILISLYEQSHGYGIMQKVEQLSGGRVRLAAGTLYGALSSLLGKGWIDALPGAIGERKKEYIITWAGRQAAEQELERLRQLVANGEQIIGG